MEISPSCRPDRNNSKHLEQVISTIKGMCNVPVYLNAQVRLCGWVWSVNRCVFVWFRLNSRSPLFFCFCLFNGLVSCVLVSLRLCQIKIKLLYSLAFNIPLCVGVINSMYDFFHLLTMSHLVMMYIFLYLHLCLYTPSCLALHFILECVCVVKNKVGVLVFVLTAHNSQEKYCRRVKHK